MLSLGCKKPILCLFIVFIPFMFIYQWQETNFDLQTYFYNIITCYIHGHMKLILIGYIKTRNFSSRKL